MYGVLLWNRRQAGGEFVGHDPQVRRIMLGIFTDHLMVKRKQTQVFRKFEEVSVSQPCGSFE